MIADRPFPGFQRPNSTDTPDEWYLQVAPRIRHLSELKVLLYIIYRTFGWRKWDDWISLSQFEHGQSGRDDDNGCGLSHAAILDGLERAVEDGYARRRLLCPHCNNEVERTEVERRPWKNRHGEGSKDVPIAPQDCPHCSKPLRGLERPYYRLAFADEVVDAYERPQDWLAKYHQPRLTQVENSSLPGSSQVENSSPQVENSSSDPKKLEISTSHSPSQSTSQSTDDQEPPILMDLIDLAGLQEPTARAILDRYGADEAGRWLAYVLDKGKENPAGYLVSCCLRKHDPAPAYDDEQVELILDRFRERTPEPVAPVVQEISTDEAPNELDRIWQRALDELRLQMTSNTFGRWLASSYLLALDPAACTATLSVPDKYAADWVEHRLVLPIARVLAPIAADMGIAGLDPDTLTLTCTVSEARAPPGGERIEPSSIDDPHTVAHYERF